MGGIYKGNITDVLIEIHPKVGSTSLHSLVCIYFLGGGVEGVDSRAVPHKYEVSLNSRPHVHDLVHSRGWDFLEQVYL